MPRRRRGVLGVVEMCGVSGVQQVRGGHEEGDEVGKTCDVGGVSGVAGTRVLEGQEGRLGVHGEGGLCV